MTGGSIGVFATWYEPRDYALFASRLHRPDLFRSLVGCAHAAASGTKSAPEVGKSKGCPRGVLALIVVVSLEHQ